MRLTGWLPFIAVTWIACSDGGVEIGPTAELDASVPTDVGAGAVCGEGADGRACDDGDPCTVDDVCVSGGCVGTPKSCPSSSACQVGACDPVTGACEERPATDGTRCEDGDLCTVGDACSAGACAPGEPVVCDGSATCVVGSCNPETGRCEGEPVADGTACENACVTRGRCSDGECEGRPILCDSPGDCRNLLGCDPQAGCLYESINEGLGCSDGDVCTHNDRCEDGACVGRELVCPEPPECKASICDPDDGCALADLPDGTECDDGNLCTFDTECEAGECVARAAVNCDTGPCIAVNSCNPATGRCEPQYEAAGTACNDQNQCTEDEFCKCAQEDNCANLFCGGGTEIPWTGTLCSDDICFTDVTQAAGITWESGSNARHAHAAGGVMADLDGDGWLDILLASETEAMTLYINDQSGGFTDETATAGLTVVNSLVGTSSNTWQGVSAGDYDDDGDFDLYVSFNGPNFLLENDGTGSFTDVTAASGAQDYRWSTGSVFGDMDEDGDLDLIVGNYVAKRGSFFPNHIAIDNSVFRNNGDGTFTDVAATLNVGGAGTGRPGASLLIAFTDYDQDGDADILECNDFGQTVQPNKLYQNDGSGRFTDVSSAEGADVRLFCMGIAQGDYDRDLDFDYYHTSIGHHAFLSGGSNGFTDVAAVTQTRLENDDCFQFQKQAGWGAILEDLDNDGWQDLFVVNGYIVADSSITNPVEQENKVLKNLGFGQAFDDISKSAGVADTGDARGLMAGDYDRDGDVDVLVVNMTGPPHLYRNDSVNQGHHLVLGLEGRISNRFAPNAIITAEFESFTLIREYGVRPGYASPSPTEVYLGAGSEETARSIEVEWPSGIHSRIYAVPTDGRLELIEPEVTLEGFMVSGSLTTGARLTATATLTNHVATTRSVDLDVELWDSRDQVLSTVRESYIVDGLANEVVQVQVTAPSTLPSGPMRWVASVSDAAGATDQDEDLP